MVGIVDTLVMTAVDCLIRLLPTMGRNRVASSTALRYVFEDTAVSAICY